jgi:ATP-dependent exoDNAse (exonuclease V) alpha subunit
VLLIDEWFRDDRVQWLYTAITRARERIVIVSKARELFSLLREASARVA